MFLTTPSSFCSVRPTSAFRRTLTRVLPPHASSFAMRRHQFFSTSSPPPFDKLLVANRGEIACRIIRTCERLGIRTVAIYSEADGRNSLHASLADEAYKIGSGPEASKSYLLGDEVLNIAAKADAQAIHPGYGFLSENSSFASACASRDGITFVGPPPSAIRAMGSKSDSKRIMMDANVPCTPGYHGSDEDSQDPEFLLRQATETVGFPCLIKATMGGGGKGMRLVSEASQFLDALDSCKREALSSFGDGTVILERYLVKPRHVEVQICADSHGNAVHLHERDCSVQRRHQKVLEEAPAPGLGDDVRRSIGEVAVRAAKAVGYVGAGTVEFLMEEGSDEFYFCEMNTRLQVEHPVTEMVTGVDLVEWQLRVAAGEELPILDQGHIRTSGHAVEARVYAENPAKNFLPATGKLHHLRAPSGEGVRVDTGVREGDDVSVFYDPMISKLIAYGPDRASAIDKLLLSLRSYQVVGLPTNISFLEKCAGHPAFRRGAVNTGFLDDYADDVRVEETNPMPSPVGQALCVLSLLLTMEGRVGVKDLAEERKAASPWSNLSGSWRGGRSFEQVLNFSSKGVLSTTGEDAEHSILSVSNGDGSFTLSIGGEMFVVNGTLTKDGCLQATVNEKRFSITSVVHEQEDGALDVNLWSEPGKFIGQRDEYTCSMTLPNVDRAASGALGGTGSITAPMPGKVIRVNSAVGESVEAGDVLLVLEAMKMEHSITSPGDGILATLSCSVGDIVDDGSVLAVVGSDENGQNMA